ncbi:hypothetical protein CVT26_010691 [Gymnopilus dilepis]|uniref:Uncharacterized protein n=1 Tax=Gymnopilus dilepis TaxID=231916 RepID=A0A409Y0U6_9AGAR|nr:hypothetical protein CVT26_010691 [Gymnopilus dilepis]
MSTSAAPELPFEGYIPFEEGKLLPEEIVRKALLAVQAAGHLLPPPEIVVPLPAHARQPGSRKNAPKYGVDRARNSSRKKMSSSSAQLRNVLPGRIPSQRIRGPNYTNDAVSVRRHLYEFCQPPQYAYYELR